MKGYKIFTESEFKQRVEVLFNLMIKSDYPNKVLNMKISKAYRTLGSYRSSTAEFKFSPSILDGRYSLESVDDIIKHELGHYRDELENNRVTCHDAKFKALGRRFGFCGDATTKSNPLIKSPIYKDVVISSSKYVSICKCGYAIIGSQSLTKKITHSERYTCKKCKSKLERIK